LYQAWTGALSQEKPVGNVLEASTKSNFLKTWHSKCQYTIDMRPEKLDICVCACVYLHYMPQVCVLLAKRDACILFVICLCILYIFAIAISNCLFFLCRLKINHMMNLQRYAFTFILEPGVVTNILNLLNLLCYCFKAIWNEFSPYNGAKTT
jgi:hypothetical protein